MRLPVVGRFGCSPLLEQALRDLEERIGAAFLGDGARVVCLPHFEPIADVRAQPLVVAVRIVFTRAHRGLGQQGFYQLEIRLPPERILPSWSRPGLSLRLAALASDAIDSAEERRRDVLLAQRRESACDGPTTQERALHDPERALLSA